MLAVLPSLRLMVCNRTQGPYSGPASTCECTTVVLSILYFRSWNTRLGFSLEGLLSFFSGVVYLRSHRAGDDAITLVLYSKKVLVSPKGRTRMERSTEDTASPKLNFPSLFLNFTNPGTQTNLFLLLVSLGNFNGVGFLKKFLA